MSAFSIRSPYFIIVCCLMIAVVGITSLARMPVDMFPAVRIPVVVVATFYNGMPPEQIEADITSRFERFFTLASGIEHIESRSLPGVSMIKVYFQPGMDPDAAVSTISNLAMANLRRLPQGTLPPVVLKFDASSFPVCLVALQGEGIDEVQVRDLAQYTVRNQVAVVPGASVPQPFGGKYRQIMVYADPLKLEAHQLSLMDVVRSVNDSNLILPAGNLPIGRLDYSIYMNSQVDTIAELNEIPLKVVQGAPVRIADIGAARDAAQVQTSIVRVNGVKSVYAPVLRQGGDSNTIAIVDGVKEVVAKLTDVPDQLKSSVVFDQSKFVKTAIQTLLHEGALGLILTSLMILIFLGSLRSTLAVFFSIPLSVLATFMCLALGGGTVNSMVLGGLALAFSRLIDNSVVVLENIHRYLEMGGTPEAAAEQGGREVTLPVLAATLTTVVVFFPVTFLYGVSRFLFTALALAVVLAMVASYFVAMTVVPLFCSRFLKAHDVEGHHRKTLGERWLGLFNRVFERFLDVYEWTVRQMLRLPAVSLAVILGLCALPALLLPRLDMAFFPRTDAGQFQINLKSASGTRLSATEADVEKAEQIVREEIPAADLEMTVSNIGVTPGFSSIYTSNSAPHTSFMQVALRDERSRSSFYYMDAVRARLARDLPHVTAFFQSGGLVEAVLNLGMPAPIDIQVSGSNLENNFKIAVDIAARVRSLPGVSDVYIPQDIDYPALSVQVDRLRAGKLGLTSKEVVQNVITALSSNQMIAPSYWVDPKSGTDYMLTVQYPEHSVRTLEDFRAIPIRSPGQPAPARLGAVTHIERAQAPTEVDRYQFRRTIDVYVRPAGEDLGRLASAVDQIVAQTKLPRGTRIDVRGMVQGMRQSFSSFGYGLLLAVVLLYLILVAQFKSFADPMLILLAVPPGLAGALLTLVWTDTSLNVMSLMGVVMLVGIVVSNSILIVEFAHRQREKMPAFEAVVSACRIRLRPVLMTSLATVIGLLPMALKLGAGSEAYAPLARSILGGLLGSLATTVFIVPAAYLLLYRTKE
ncbi:MAG: efflux RND transporter permease subunit [Bryobacterales bacterium]|nr:efflux RND transporter permease subunit [Bryobacterales bacterium]